ncbi:MAG TPA: hypothetical protein VFY05_14110 [Candidatus Angelobacter sp.]|nr:hypothetical protein [Candidatus Angelobacter sp.]
MLDLRQQRYFSRLLCMRAPVQSAYTAEERILSVVMALASMRVKKFKSSGMLYSRLLSEHADSVRRSAQKTAQAAQEAVHHSANLVEQSRDALERADAVLRNSVQGREDRAARKKTMLEATKRTNIQKDA